MITSFIYSSKSTSELNLDLLGEIQKVAETENKKNDITGYLTYKKDTFIQYIEGPEEKINQLIINLKRDNRHQFNKSIFLTPKTNRFFMDWSMKYIEYNKLIEIGYHDLLETVFFTVGNRIFDENEVIEKLTRMLIRISQIQNSNSVQ